MENGEFQICGGSVTAVANDTNLAKGTKSLGIFCDVGNDGNNIIDGAGNIVINNAIVSSTGGAAETSAGIVSKYHLNISGDATVVAVGGVAKETDYNYVNNRLTPRTFGLGCTEMGSITIQDSTVIATGGSFSFNGNIGDVTNQSGRSCGIYCGRADRGVITFHDCVVVARAGTVNARYDVAENKRCAVFNMNSNTQSSEIAIKFDGTKVAGAAGYDGGGIEMLQNARIVTVNDYSVNFNSFPPTESTPLRSTIGISPNNEPQTAISATGVVIVPDDWTIPTTSDYLASMDLDGGTVIVNTRANAMTMTEDVEIKTAGNTLAAVSLYEGLESADTAGISAEGSFSLSGGGEVIAVGGITSGASYGIKSQATPRNVVVDTTTLTTYGFHHAMNTVPVLIKDLKDVSVVAFPAGYQAADNADYPLMKILPAYPLRVNGVQVNGLNKTNVLGDDTVRYDPQSATLTLNGATINGISSNGLDINLAMNGINTVNKNNTTGHGIAVMDGDLTIQSNGTSTVGTDAIGGIGISVGGSLIINGSGSMTVAANGSNGTGVQVPSDASVIINGGGFLASGMQKAMDKAPNFTGYTGNYAVRASTNVDGSNAVRYNEAENVSYKFFNINPIAPGTNVTVYNAPLAADATVWLSGVDLFGYDLLVTDKLTSGSDYNAMLRLLDTDEVFWMSDVHLQSGISSTGKAMYLGFDLGEKYAGQAFTLAHRLSNGQFEYFYSVVGANGDAVFGPLYSLSPFMLVKGTVKPVVPDIPKTGDSATPGLWIVMLMGAGLVASVALTRRRRKA